VAVLLDTSAVILLSRRSPPAITAALRRAADEAIRDRCAMLPAVAVTELLLGESSEAGQERLRGLLARLPILAFGEDPAVAAGWMGGFLRSEGRPIPLPDLQVAGTAVWMELELLSWDTDFALARRLASESGSDSPGARLWRALRLHPASITSP
jgi:predicted nucleic acid-binding protein